MQKKGEFPRQVDGEPNEFPPPESRRVLVILVGHVGVEAALSPAPQTRLWALLRSTAYQPVSCNAAKVTGSIRTVTGSPSTGAMMEPCRTRDSQWEEALPGAAPWGGRRVESRTPGMGGGGSGRGAHQVLQRGPELGVRGCQVCLQGRDDSRAVEPHLARRVGVEHFTSGGAGGSSCSTTACPPAQGLSPQIGWMFLYKLSFCSLQNSNFQG